MLKMALGFHWTRMKESGRTLVFATNISDRRGEEAMINVIVELMELK